MDENMNYRNQSSSNPPSRLAQIDKPDMKRGGAGSSF